MGDDPDSIREKIVRRTVFFSYMELTDMANEIVARHPEVRDEELGKAVLDAVSRVRPAISLGAYRTRVLGDAIPDRKPLEEFAILAHLILEADGHLDDDRRWVRDPLEEALKEEVVRDQAVADRLRRELGLGS